MAVTSRRFTQYYIECDFCPSSECCPDAASEGVRNKKEAVRWAGMKLLKDGRVVCRKCLGKVGRQEECNELRE